MSEYLDAPKLVEFFYTLQSDPHRECIYDTKVCKAPNRTHMWRDMLEFVYRRDVSSYFMYTCGWRVKGTNQGVSI